MGAQVHSQRYYIGVCRFLKAVDIEDIRSTGQYIPKRFKACLSLGLSLSGMHPSVGRIGVALGASPDLFEDFGRIEYVSLFNQGR
jgi:hypothetical protein